MNVNRITNAGKNLSVLGEQLLRLADQGIGRNDWFVIAGLRAMLVLVDRLVTSDAALPDAALADLLTTEETARIVLSKIDPEMAH